VIASLVVVAVEGGSHWLPAG